MNILFPTVGSAGDVLPVVALALALRDLGHRPFIVTNDHFRPLAEGHGLDFIALGSAADYRQISENPDLWHPKRAFPALVHFAIAPHVRPLFEIISRFDPTKTVVASAGLLYGAAIAHEKLGTPHVTLHLQPALFRTLHDMPTVGGFRLPDWLPPSFKRSYLNLLDRAVVDRAIGPVVNPLRAELGLPPQSHFFGEPLHGRQLSLGLFPAWFAPPQPDWPSQVRLTGFISLGGDQPALDPELAAFLDDGEPPIVFTPGTAMRHGQSFFAAACDAALRLGRRAVLLTPYREQVPAGLPPAVRHFDYAPFSRLLPRSAALVYHGGIGTLAQGLAAGIPHLVMPMAHDQPDNARRLARLGVGDSLAPRRFHGPAVAARLQRLLDSPEVQANCRRWATRVDFQQAVAETCDAILTLAPAH